MTTILAQAKALFQVASDDKVRNVLFALGFKDVCGRCAGSGRYSWNQLDGDRCFGCRGAGYKPAKLTKAVFAQAKAKVEAGELVAIREAAARKAEAKRSLSALALHAREIYNVIAAEYSSESAERALDGTLYGTPVWYAQHMNNALYWGYMSAALHSKSRGDSVEGIMAAVERGQRKDYEQCAADLRARIIELMTLRDAWLQFKDAQ